MGNGLLAWWRRRIASRGLVGAALCAVPIAVAALIGFETGLSGIASGLAAIGGPDTIPTSAQTGPSRISKVNRAMVTLASNSASSVGSYSGGGSSDTKTGTGTGGSGGSGGGSSGSSTTSSPGTGTGGGDTVNSTVDNTVGTVDNTVNNTVGTLDNTVNNTVGTVDNTVNNTVNSVNNTLGGVDTTVNGLLSP